MSNSENWSFYNYLGGHSGSAFPTTVRNPNKAICTINAKTSEVGLLHLINFDIGILLNFIFKLARHEDKCNFFCMCCSFKRSYHCNKIFIRKSFDFVWSDSHVLQKDVKNSP
jgi:hypothetical protein